MSDDRYDVIEWRGHKFDKYTVAAIEAAEAKLGHQLVVMQGSYNAGTGKVSASAGTHDGGGAVDFGASPNVRRDVRVLRSVGFAAWYRSADEGPWGPHVHAVLIDNTAASPSAQRQVVAYKNGRNGLASNLNDPTWRPDPIPTFDYPEEDMPLSDNDAAKVVQALLKTKLKVNKADGTGTEERYVSSILVSLFNADHPLKES